MPLDVLSSQGLMGSILAFLLIIVLSLVVITALLGILYLLLIWKKAKERHQKSLDSTILEVALPRDNEIKIDAAEQMFSSFASIKRSGTFSFLSISDSISFEIVAKPADIRFYVGVPNKLKDMVEKQIHGAYPGAQIQEVEE